jgi:hypothetical protein
LKMNAGIAALFKQKFAHINWWNLNLRLVNVIILMIISARYFTR